MDFWWMCTTTTSKKDASRLKIWKKLWNSSPSSCPKSKSEAKKGLRYEQNADCSIAESWDKILMWGDLFFLKTSDRGSKQPTTSKSNGLARQELYNEDLSESKPKSKSLQFENTVNFLEPMSQTEYLRKKSEKKNLQLQEAYKPILPNDIYKNYYGGKFCQGFRRTKFGTCTLAILYLNFIDTPRLYNKQASPREKKFLLPLITQKPFAI